ncbi:MAG: type II toxin-antitoxin system VapC family toxin [Gemmatimonadota bacterium]
MVLDSSALVALLLGEADSRRLAQAIASAPIRLVGAPTLVETSAVLLARKGPEADVALDAWLMRLDVEVVPLTEEGARHARRAYARFGKGVGDPGVLNYGDCLSYGVAMAMRQPLLFKGDDFSRTDVEVAAY